jgi:hypothetical protein
MVSNIFYNNQRSVPKLTYKLTDIIENSQLKEGLSNHGGG